ncbi:hypothetical protein B0H14DRAFT_3433355 [Mycena olivaceomarginata]|nr:hypothetical protein B0H14DRAFT_3433355 [Mycena olivaceomarginata]
MLPGAFAQSMPYQPHNDGYRLAFGTEPGSFSDNLLCAQYAKPLKFSPQLAALDQKLNFFTHPSREGRAEELTAIQALGVTEVVVSPPLTVQHIPS